MTLQEIIETIASIKQLCDAAIGDMSATLIEEQQELLGIILRSTEPVLEFLPQYEEEAGSEEVTASLIFDLRSPLNAITNATAVSPFSTENGQ